MSYKFNERMLFSKTILERLDNEAVADCDLGESDNPVWCAVGILEDHKPHQVRNFQPGAIKDTIGLGIVLDPPEHQIAFMLETAKTLINECHHDGTWIGALTHPPQSTNLLLVEPCHDWQRMLFIWVDQEGDPQFTIDYIDPLPELMQSGLEHFVEQAEQARMKWEYLMREVIAPKDNQLIAAAAIREG